MKYWIAAVLFVTTSFASDLRPILGVKYPNSGAHSNAESEGDSPVAVFAWAPATTQKITSSSIPGTPELDFVLRSPDQEDAGSCLYMSLTGIVEYWLAKLHPELSRAPDGPVDLSERYLMNLAGLEENENGVANWKTDSIEILNRAGHSVLNSNYRFRKGWYRSDSQGNLLPSKQGQAGAEYGVSFNWIDQIDTISMTASATRVPLPHFSREVLFADPESNQWNVGVMPENAVELVKNALKKRGGPVHVIYNHYGYWHAVMIVGYSDSMATEGCQFSTRFGTYMRDLPAKLRAKANETLDANAKETLLKRALKTEKISKKFDQAWLKQRGCNPTGMFFVRDSIYPDQSAPLYDYDPSQVGDESHYTQQVVAHEYAWLQTMANHLTVIYPSGY